MGAAFTGQMLPMDDEAVKGAEVAAAYAAQMGAADVVRGGSIVGPPMLTRMFSAHVIWIPAGLILLVAGHLALVGRHRLHGAEALEGTSPNFLKLLGLTVIAVSALLATLAFVWPAGVGAPPGSPDAPASAKPMWMFLPVYQAAKHVSGPWTVLLLLGPPALLIAIPFLPRRVALGAGLLLIVAAVSFGILGAAS
jgi:cytochrome b-561